MHHLRNSLCLLALASAPVAAAPMADNEIAALRAEINSLRADYEARILQLEQRVASAEAQQAGAAASQQLPPPVASSARSGNAAFNPAIGVIFEGQAWNNSRDPDEYRIPGFPLGGETGQLPEGLALGETEINASANVDDKFTARLTVPIVVEDGDTEVELEEAWLETLALPGGLSARFGRFYSGIGYQNGRHAHSWDFIDQPLPYQAFLGNQYVDDGVQLRWLAPTDLYLEVGAELLRGDRYPVTGAEHSGAGTWSLFGHLGGDLGAESSWQAGLSWLSGSSGDRAAGDGDDPLLFNGDTDIAIADLVWKWAPQGNWSQRNLVFQAEYLRRSEKGVYSAADQALDYDADQDGWYAQLVYQFMPRWRAGVRYDTVATDDPGQAFAGTALAPPGDDPARYSVMLDWSNSEFSRLRLQYTRDEAGDPNSNQWGLQYIHSIGAHGAHSF